MWSCLFIGACFVVRMVWSSNTPLTLLYYLRHDDGHFVSQAEQLLSGRWLGDFDQYTLMKGPGYPFFIALAAGTGLPLTIVHGLFQFLAISAAAWAVSRLTASRTLGLIILAVLAFLPLGFDLEYQRLLRDQIYWGQSLLIFAGLAVLLLVPPVRLGHRLLLAAMVGVTFGWAWLTREEGEWFLPGLAVLVFGSVFRTWLARAPMRRVAVDIGGVAIAFALTTGAFMAANLAAYGSFIGVDFKETNFNAALRALQSIEAGQRIEYVPVSEAARQLASEVSPTFAPLAISLRTGGRLHGWSKHGCSFYPQTCGDIAGGWFVWAFRDAAALEGYYNSPAIAAVKFGKIASELQDACATGQLRCQSNLLSSVPPMNAAQWASVPWRALTGLGMISLGWFQTRGTLNPTPAADDTAGLSRVWAFLNFPKIIGPATSVVRVKGWYRNSDDPSEWMQLRESSQEAGRLAAQTRYVSPDLVSFFNDPSASDNRFSVELLCSVNCTVQAVFADGTTIEVPAQPGANTTVGSRTIWVDEAVADLYPGSVVDDRSTAVWNLTTLAYSVYRIALPVALGVGTGCLLISLLLGLLRRRLSPSLVAASAALIFVVTRVAVLAIVDAGSFPGIYMPYLLPAAYLAPVAAALAIGALLNAREQSVA